MHAQSGQPSFRPAERVVLSHLARAGAQTRSRIADATGLARPTVVSAVASLTSDGLLREIALSAPATVRGRPSSSFDLDWIGRGLAFVSWKRSALTLSLLDEAGRPLRSTPLSSGVLDTPDLLADEVTRHLDLWARSSGVSWLVLGAPMPVDPAGGLVPTRSDRPAASASSISRRAIPEWLTGHPAHELDARLPAQVLVENDANLAALGEYETGVRRGSPSLAAVTVRDGIGAGLVFEGRLHRGTGGLAGELAHVQVDPTGRLCVCGNRGCLATVLSGGPLFVDEISQAYGRELSFHDLVDLAERGDVGVIRVLRGLGIAIGSALSSAVGLLGVQDIVVDGDLDGAGPAVAEGLRTALADRVMPAIASNARVTMGATLTEAEGSGASHLARQLFASHLLDTDKF